MGESAAGEAVAADALGGGSVRAPDSIDLVIYHANCADGFCSAWVANRQYPEAEFVAAQYGMDPPDVAGRHVLIVDFSYPRDTLLRMHGEAASLLVLDHHKSAREDLEGLDFCVFDMERSGAGITWDVLLPGEARPKLVDYVEDRDLWRHALPDSKPINAVVKLAPSTFEAWDLLGTTLEFHQDEVAGQGDGVLSHLTHYAKKCAEQSFPVQVRGHESISAFAVILQYEGVSDALHETLALRGCEAAIGIIRPASGGWTFSIRTIEGVDGGAVAKSFGGGGHARAAGWRGAKWDAPFLPPATATGSGAVQ